MYFEYPTTKLPVLTGRIYDSIVKAYYGGHVDMYIPKILALVKLEPKYKQNRNL